MSLLTFDSYTRKAHILYGVGEKLRVRWNEKLWTKNCLEDYGREGFIWWMSMQRVTVAAFYHDLIILCEKIISFVAVEICNIIIIKK